MQIAHTAGEKMPRLLHLAGETPRFVSSVIIEGRRLIAGGDGFNAAHTRPSAHRLDRCGNFSRDDWELIEAIRAAKSTEAAAVGLSLAVRYALETFNVSYAA